MTDNAIKIVVPDKEMLSGENLFLDQPNLWFLMTLLKLGYSACHKYDLVTGSTVFRVFKNGWLTEPYLINEDRLYENPCFTKAALPCSSLLS